MTGPDRRPMNRAQRRQLKRDARRLIADLQEAERLAVALIGDSDPDSGGEAARSA